MFACLIIISSQEEYNSFVRNSLAPLRSCEIPLIVGIRKGIDFSDLNDSEVFVLSDFSSLVEVNRAALYPEICTYNNILTMDPDEIYSVELLKDVIGWTMKSCRNDIGEIPFQYFFKGKPLHGTAWGRIRYFPKVLSPQHIRDVDTVHGRPEGIYCRVETDYFVKHMWADNLSELRRRHDRYIRSETESKQTSLASSDPLRFILRVLRIFLVSVKKFSLRDGIWGVLLSIEFIRYYLLVEWGFLRKLWPQIIR